MTFTAQNVSSLGHERDDKEAFVRGLNLLWQVPLADNLRS